MLGETKYSLYMVKFLVNWRAKWLQMLKALTDFLFVFSPLSVLAASGVLHGTTGIPTALIVLKLAKFRGL